MAGKKKQGIAGLKDTAGGGKRDDRLSMVRLSFKPISIDAENVLTVIYMLRSPEGSVVLRAVASLERFGKKATENLELLLTSGIFDYILPLVQHEDYLVRRFAQKLIALLAALEDFRQQILLDDMTVNIFVTILEKEEDVVMHEFSSLTLKELSSECSAAGRILQIEGCVDILYLRLSSPDPDVQKNCLDTMKNLLNEIDGVHFFIYSPHFDLKPVLLLAESKYPVIQIAALQVIEQFMSWSMDSKILSAFRDSSGVEVIIGIVENPDWDDLHESALDILLKVVDNPIICDYLQQSGCLQRLAALFESYPESFYPEKLLGVFARVSQSKGGRKALQAYNVGLRFGEYLQKDWSGVQEPACLGVANMAQYPPALDSIMSTKPMSRLLGIVTDLGKSWKLRGMAAYAMNILSHEDRRAAEELLQDNSFEKLLPLLVDERNIPMEVILDILQIFIGITVSEKCRNLVVNEKVVKSIMNLLQGADEPYLKPAKAQVAAMECLSGFLIENTGRTIFHNLEGAPKLIGCLKNRYASIRQWAAVMVTQMAQNVDFVKCFIRRQGLQWYTRLIDRKDMRYSAPSWESAIDAVFRAYLPAKFAFTGRLDLHDLTEESFYVLRHQRKLFFILEDLLEIKASPAYPVYVANFSPCTVDSKECLTISTSCSTTRTGLSAVNRKERDQDSQRPQTGKGRNITDVVSESSAHPSYDTYGVSGDMNLKSFGSCPPDPYLPEYLTKLKAKLHKYCNFRDPQWLGIHPKLIRERAKILARFVADEMSGPDPDLVCKDHFLEMHLNDIRHELETNVIPVGHIRMGSYLERAFLFKILADKVGLPCALVRGPFGRAWVEIAVPVINVNEATEAKQTQTFFPKTPPPSVRSNLTPDGDVSSEEDARNEMGCQKEAARRGKFPPVDMSFANAFPTRLLRANAIVDLVHEPGRILPLGSYEADEYRGSFLYLDRNKRGKCH